MNDALAETRLGGEMVGKMDRIAVAGEVGEGDHVVVHDRLHQRLAHADAQIFEIIDFEGRRHWGHRNVASGDGLRGH